MTISLILACLWAVLANILAMTPSKDNHWRRAYFLIALGLPVVAFVAYQNGVWVAGIVLIAGISVLRWPMVYLVRWLRRIALR